MSEKEKHLATFQNLCVIAHLDGSLHPEERALLNEMAEGMGLSEAEIAPLISRGPRLDFIIPATKEERLIELRMVVLTMLSDGRMDEREYDGCLQLAKQMELDQSHLDEIVEFYTEVEKERLQHIGIFQNLYLIAQADGVIDPHEQQLLLEVARTLGLSQRDVDQVLESQKPLDFVIPDNEDERYFTLKNLIYMMVVDGKIAKEEYDLCLYFAESIGMGEEEIDTIIEEYKLIQRERKGQQEEVEEANTNTYLDLFNEFYQLELKVEDWLLHIRQAEQLGHFDVPDTLNEAEQVVYFRLMWLIFVRSYQLSDEAEVMVPLHLDLARAKNNLQDLLNFLLSHERIHGAEPIDIYAMPMVQIKKELAERLRTLYLGR